MNSPCCSIVIPVFNRVALTSACLDALHATIDQAAHEVIVVDNASTDGTAAMLATHPLAPRAIRNDQNLGFARACNQGAKAARGEFVLFLNNDTVPQSRWLEPLLEIVRREPAVAAVGSRLLYPDSHLIQHAGVAYNPDPYHLWHGFPADWPAANQQQDVVAVTGACMLVRRSTFEELGPFDEQYVNGFEDIDFCQRLCEKGRRIVYCPMSVVLHYEGMTEGRTRHEDRNHRLFMQRWRDRLREQAVPRRELIVAACDEVFRISRSGNSFVAIGDGRLIRHDVNPPTVYIFRHRIARQLTALWLRLRYFFRWRKARRMKAELRRTGRSPGWGERRTSIHPQSDPAADPSAQAGADRRHLSPQS